VAAYSLVDSCDTLVDLLQGRNVDDGHSQTCTHGQIMVDIHYLHKSPMVGGGGPYISVTIIVRQVNT
jgi:hypothetical protein